MTVPASGRTGRLDLLREIAARPFARVVGAVYALLGIIGVVREIVFPEQLQATFNFYRFWQLDWPWHIWSLIAAVGVVAIVFEGAYTAVLKRENQLRTMPPLASRGDRPKLTISGDRKFAIYNVGTAAAYHVSAAIELPNADLKLELQPISQVLPGASVEVRFVGHGWGKPTLLDDNTVRLFLSRVFLGEVVNWTVQNYRLIEIEFDLMYTDFAGDMVFKTPHTLRFGADHATTDILAEVSRSTKAEEATARSPSAR